MTMPDLHHQGWRQRRGNVYRQPVRTQSGRSPTGGDPQGLLLLCGGGDPIQEAEHFASLVADLQPGEILAIDLEIDHPDPVAYAWTFLVRTEHLTGSKPLLYTNMNRVWVTTGMRLLRTATICGAPFYDEQPQGLTRSRPWPAVAVKQYTSEGTLPGINSNVDLMSFQCHRGFQGHGQITPKIP